jgi:D-alanyl-D-alanine carboxypeptidase (penicillin-binding protein 5/6)
MRRFSSYSIALFLSLALGFSAVAAPQQGTKKSGTTKKPTSAEQSKPKSSPTPAAALPDDGSPPKTRAGSVILIDAQTGRVLHERNADQPRPVASTQKLLTALLIVEAGDLQKEVTVTASDTYAEPVKLYLKPGDVYTRYDLLQILMVRSMNDVARCLARDNAGSVDAFVDKMNAKAEAMGLTQTHFVNPNGLPAPGQFSTARELARIAYAAYHNKTIRSMVSLRKLKFHYADGRVREFTNTNRVLKNWALCNGMKTGYTEASGFCLVSSASENGREVIAVVLGATREGVVKDSYALLSWGLKAP